MFNRHPDGVLLVDAQARILFANVVAEDMLRKNLGLRSARGQLAAASPASTAALHRLIAGGGGGVEGDLIVLPCPDGARRQAMVLPLRAAASWLLQPPAAIVFVKGSRSRLPSRQQLRRLFDLTPAQAGVAHEILRGDGVRAVAERLGIAEATVRSHLLAIFQKAGTTHQAELVRVILQQSFPDRGGVS